MSSGVRIAAAGTMEFGINRGGDVSIPNVAR
jgi:hypothetical protein